MLNEIKMQIDFLLDVQVEKRRSTHFNKAFSVGVAVPLRRKYYCLNLIQGYSGSMIMLASGLPLGELKRAAKKAFSI